MINVEQLTLLALPEPEATYLARLRQHLTLPPHPPTRCIECNAMSGNLSRWIRESSIETLVLSIPECEDKLAQGMAQFAEAFDASETSYVDAVLNALEHVKEWAA